MSGAKSEKQIKEIKPKCFDRERKHKDKKEELDRQLKNQQDGLNSMTVNDYLEGRNEFLGYHPCTMKKRKGGKVKRDPKVAREARREEIIRRQEKKSKQFLSNKTLLAEKKKQYGLTSEAAVNKKLRDFSMVNAAKQRGWSAEKKLREVVAMADSRSDMKSLAALHNPDMVAGGKDKITGFGDRNINSMIGSSWNSGKNSRVSELDAAACRESQKGNGDKNMNVKLTRCGQEENKRSQQ